MWCSDHHYSSYRYMITHIFNTAIKAMVEVGGLTLAELILFAVPYLELLRNESGQEWPIHIIVILLTGAKLFEDWAASLTALMHAVIEPCSFNKWHNFKWCYLWLFLLPSRWKHWRRFLLSIVLIFSVTIVTLVELMMVEMGGPGYLPHLVMGAQRILYSHGPPESYFLRRCFRYWRELGPEALLLKIRSFGRP